MQQMLCSVGRSKSLAITVSPFLFKGRPSRDSSSAPEGTLCFRQAADSELIDAGSLDDQFLMAFTEDFRVNQPGRRAAAHGALNASHGVDLMPKRARKLAPLVRIFLGLWFTADAGRCGRPLAFRSRSVESLGGPD